jgi:hypothetical protein
MNNSDSNDIQLVKISLYNYHEYQHKGVIELLEPMTYNYIGSKLIHHNIDNISKD